jgi:hypothetical protein
LTYFAAQGLAKIFTKSADFTIEIVEVSAPVGDAVENVVVFEYSSSITNAEGYKMSIKNK